MKKLTYWIYICGKLNKKVRICYMSDSSPINFKRQRSSPGDSDKTLKKKNTANMADYNSSEFAAAIRAVMTGLLDEKLAPVATKEDIALLRIDITELKEENARLKAEIESLKALSTKSDSRIEELELASRRNNLIFKGVTYSPSADLNSTIGHFCRDLLKVDVSSDQFNVIPLGNVTSKPNRPLLVSFLRLQDKIKVLNCTRILKGTGFVVHQDLPEATRKKRSNLLLLRREIMRLNNQIGVGVRTNYLLVDGCKFFWSDQDGLRFAGGDGTQKLSSLVKVNLHGFIAALLTGNLPKDYFSSACQNATGSSLLPAVPSATS